VNTQQEERERMARIIKLERAASEGSSGSPTVFQFDDVAQQTQALVAEARKEAELLLEAARAEAVTIRARAEEEGLEAARTAAERQKEHELQQQLETALPALQAAASSLVATRQTWLQRWETDAVRLCCRIAGKLVRREVQADPRLSLVLLREALELAAGQQRVRVQLHPKDFELLENHARQVAQQWSQLCTTEIEPCSEVPAGSCRLKTEHGVIDQSFHVQLQRIEDELLS
jgi:flagellar assembly protein FliH